MEVRLGVSSEMVPPTKMDCSLTKPSRNLLDSFRSSREDKAAASSAAVKPVATGGGVCQRGGRWGDSEERLEALLKEGELSRMSNLIDGRGVDEGWPRRRCDLSG